MQITHLRVKSRLREIEKIRRFLEKSLSGVKLSEQAYYIIELSLLEMCINIIRYAYPEGVEGDIFLKTWREGGRLYFEIRDSGVPFDPNKVGTVDIKESIKKRKRGGMGIFLTRKLMDGFQYRREKNQNVLTMYKEIEDKSIDECGSV
ncbi:MAG: ATP-binding protein [Candidatus Aminicenantales bacterium]